LKTGINAPISHVVKVTPEGGFVVEVVYDQSQIEYFFQDAGDDILGGKIHLTKSGDPDKGFYGRISRSMSGLTVQDVIDQWEAATSETFDASGVLMEDFIHSVLHEAHAQLLSQSGTLSPWFAQ
jgi:hypothetical protein